MVTANEALAEFLLDQQARLNSAKTIKDYSEKIGLWIKFAGDCELATVSSHDMRTYIASLRERNLARETIRSYIRALRVYWKFAADEYRIDNAMKSIKEPKRRKAQPRGVDNGDFVKLFNAIPDGEIGIRDRAILCLFADTGCRLAGITFLTIQSVDTINQRAAVIEKGYKQRNIYWTHYTNQVLCKWLAIRPKCDSDAVFISMREGHKPSPLTKSGIRQVLKRLKKAAGVTGKANPHAFRHNFARQYLLSGGDLVTLARILGHKDINMTADYYAVFDDKELSELQAKHSPLLKMLAGRAG